MGDIYSLVYPGDFHKVFPTLSPCNCHRENAYNPPLYHVSTRTGTRYCVGHGYIVKEVDVTCESCGARQKFNVEDLEVYENALNVLRR